MQIIISGEYPYVSQSVEPQHIQVGNSGFLMIEIYTGNASPCQSPEMGILSALHGYCEGVIR
jgi:hypothetical protein